MELHLRHEPSGAVVTPDRHQGQGWQNCNSFSAVNFLVSETEQMENDL